MGSFHVVLEFIDKSSVNFTQNHKFQPNNGIKNVQKWPFVPSPSPTLPK